MRINHVFEILEPQFSCLFTIQRLYGYDDD